MALNKTGLLQCKQEISDFFDGASDHILDKYLKLGMPVYIQGKRWLAHVDNLERWAKVITNKQRKEDE